MKKYGFDYVRTRVQVSPSPPIGTVGLATVPFYLRKRRCRDNLKNETNPKIVPLGHINRLVSPRKTKRLNDTLFDRLLNNFG